ncbi:MAG: hypothetical protein KC613_20440, partial [Myxococcales bacterium]|nr:hypothetical protein [Myxococcales bacterium]
MSRWITRGLSAALALTGAAPLTACDDGQQPAGDPPIEVALPDAAPQPDAAPPPDAAVDAAPPPILDAPEAWVYENDPITDRGELSQVILNKSTDPEGRLTSDWVQVFNCLNEDGGVTAMPDLGGFQITVQLCREEQTVRPDPDGHYLSIEPPADASDPNDPFAEVMMYHHVNRAHDYFKGTHGFDGLDFPLTAIVNLQLKTDPPLPIPGFQPGPDGWIEFANAAFFPEESWRQLAAQFGLPPRDGDSIIFGQAQHDFSYDARVILHEYTHAVIGTDRLQAPAVVDRYGLDNSPRSMNEGLADYFAATLADDPVVGAYGIGQLAPDLVRDLSEPRKCPADTTDEIHDHGKVVGSALWAVRNAVGPQAADGIVWTALSQFTMDTTHAEAGELFLAAATEAGLAEQVEPILTDFGLLGCERVLPFGGYRPTGDNRGIVVEGKQSLGLFGLGNGSPAYKQFRFEVPAGAPGVRL